MYQGITVTYGEDIFDCEGRLPEHFHNGFEIDYFTNADVKMFTKNMAYSIHSGDVMLLEEKCIHRMLYPAGIQYARYVINVDREFLAPVLSFYQIGEVLDRLFGDSQRKISVPMGSRAGVGELFGQLFRLCNKREHTAMDTARFQSLLVLLLDTLTRLPRSPVVESGSPADRLVGDVVGIIEGEFRENLSLETISERLHLSKYHICHAFKQGTGFSVTEYLQYCRILCAQKMLLENEESNMTDICYQCGFSNIQHFYRVFRKLSGMTPLEYRKKNRR